MSVTTRPLTVGQLTDLVQQTLAAQPELNDVLVEGELSNFVHHSSGHMYFTLKDDDCSVKAVMFRSRNSQLQFQPASGQNVFVRGDVVVWRRGGYYQLNVYTMEPAGQGALALAFAQLKQRLADEGLFEESRKLALPPYPRRVGVVTSPKAAALQDFLVTARQQGWPATIVLAPALVQGKAGAQSVVAAIERLNKADVDVIVVTRGGGSLEELWVFNEEAVARAVADSRVPVVSAVGHETDYTICDFAAAARAATPTASARLVFPDLAGVENSLKEYGRRTLSALEGLLEFKAHHLEQLARRPVLARPWQLLVQPRQNLDSQTYRLAGGFARIVQRKAQVLAPLSGRLSGLSPLAVLERGYAIVRDEKGIIASISRLARGKKVEIQLRDGRAQAEITTVGSENDE